MQQEDRVVKLFDEQMLLEDLINDTFELVKKAKNLNAVKKLIEIYDVLNLNACVLQKFRDSQLTFDEIWLDLATLKHLNRLRCELIAFHHPDFTSRKELDVYHRAFCRFINLVTLRLKNGFDVDVPKI